jgi:peptidoglycan L-alanyl-D-glutamate endopeptidase CwlK
MPRFSQKSTAILGTCHDDLQRLFKEVVTFFDCKPIRGYSAPEVQHNLFKKGRVYRNGIWVIENPLEVVTYKDGFENLSEHNYFPSYAIDILPYPLDWRDEIRICYFAGRVMQKAEEMGIPLTWGGDWDNDTEVKDQTFMDLVHFQLRR